MTDFSHYRAPVCFCMFVVQNALQGTCLTNSEILYANITVQWGTQSTVHHTACSLPCKLRGSKIHTQLLVFAKRKARGINYKLRKMNSYGGRSEHGGVRDGSKVSLVTPLYDILTFEQYKLFIYSKIENKGILKLKTEMNFISNW